MISTIISQNFNIRFHLCMEKKKQNVLGGILNIMTKFWGQTKPTNSLGVIRTLAIIFVLRGNFSHS